MSSSKKILLVPPTNNKTYIRLGHEISKSFNKFEYKSIVLNFKPSTEKLNFLIRKFSFDIVLLINYFPTNEIIRNKNLRFVVWLQDVDGSSYENYKNSNIRDGDLIYFIGDKNVMGFNERITHNYDYLPFAVSNDYIKSFKIRKNHTLDYSFIGSLLAPQYYFHSVFFEKKKIGNEMPPKKFYFSIKENYKKNKLIICGYISANQFLKSLRLFSNLLITLKDFFLKSHKYRVVRGTSIFSIIQDFLGLMLSAVEFIIFKIIPGSIGLVMFPYYYFDNERYYRIIDKDYKLFKGDIKLKKLMKKTKFNFRKDFYHIYINFPRVKDRVFLMSQIFKTNLRFKIYGGNKKRFWSKFNFSSAIDQKYLSKNFELINVFQKSKINIHTNCGGYFTLSRVLECMASGGLIMTHRSPNDYKVGGALNDFEENKHFGFYDPFNFKESTEKFLNDIKFRNKIIKNAHIKISKEYNWDVRVKKILNDLKKF